MTADAAPTPTATRAARGSSHYGIAEAIQLLRGLPVDQNTELVVRVVRATLASLSVHLADIIEDATRKQKTVQDKIASEHTKVADLEKQLADHRKEIASLEADLKETTTVKERLQMAEKSASSPAPLRGEPRPRSSRRCWETSGPNESATRISRSAPQTRCATTVFPLVAPRRRRGGDYYFFRAQDDEAVVLGRAGQEVLRDRQQLLRRDRAQQQRYAAQILDGAADRHQRDKERARVAPQDPDQLAPAEPLQVEVEDDQARRGLHQDLRRLQSRGDGSNRVSGPLQR